MRRAGRLGKREAAGLVTGQSRLLCPEGTDENSPAFQRWVQWSITARPEGTVEHTALKLDSIQSSLRDLKSVDVDPGVETPGYSHNVPSGQNQAAPRLALTFLQ